MQLTLEENEIPEHLKQFFEPVVIPGLKQKDLVGIPFRFAFAAQADGWWLRSDIIWDKPNPMPESVTDRPTKSHEYIFLLSKSPTYYFDNDAIREENARSWNPENNGAYTHQTGEFDGIILGRKTNPHGGLANAHPNPNGRNRRSVWRVATQPTPFAHFATWPEKLVEPMILAGSSAYGACSKCGAPWVRVVERGDMPKVTKNGRAMTWAERAQHGASACTMEKGRAANGDSSSRVTGWMMPPEKITTGWAASCTCNAGEPVPCTVMDPFAGSGTTLRVAARLGRSAIGVDISQEYLDEIVPQRMGSGVQMEMPL